MNIDQVIRMRHEDINRTYAGTYLGLETAKGIVPIYVEGPHEESNYDNPRIMYTVHRGERRRSVELNDPRVVLEHPDMGNYTYKDTLYYLVRETSRQYYRGVRPREIRAFLVRPDSRQPAPIPDNWFKILKDLYNEESTGSAIVLSRDVAIHHDTVFFRGYTAGTYDSKSQEVKLAKGLEYLGNHINSIGGSYVCK